MEMASAMFNIDFFWVLTAEITMDTTGHSPAPFLPPPMSIWLVMQMSDDVVKQACLKAYHKEIKMLVDARTFSIEKPEEGE